jgi:putative membrane protein
MKTSTLALALLVLGAGVSLRSTAFAADNDKSAADDRSFAMQASNVNLAEMNMGTMAAQQTNDPSIKQYAQRLIADHTKANRQLNAIADKEQIPVASRADRHQEEMAIKLSKESGAQFNRDFIQHMVAGHKKAIGLFEQEAKNGQDARLKTFASDTLPVLQEHLKMAESIEKQLGK